MNGIKNFMFILIIGMYLYISIWIYYIMQPTTMDEISEDSSEEDELIFAYVIIRHGSRSPKHTYKKDPYNNVSYWSVGWNQLTKEGKQTQFELGKFLRRRYAKLIGPNYLSKNIRIESTNEDRCLMSAQCNAAGIWNDGNDHWHPVPIHSVVQQGNCYQVKQMSDQYLQSDEIKALLLKHRRLCKYLEVHSGNQVRDVTDFVTLYDVLNVERANGFILPEWVERVLNKSGDTIELFTAIKYQSFTHTTPLKKIKGGFAIKKIFDCLKNKTMGVSKPDRMHLFVTHGHTIVNILSALNVYTLHVPPFSSSVHFELRISQTGGHYVQLFYKRDNSEHLPAVEIPNCGKKCPLDKLYQVYSDVLPNETDTTKSLCNLLK